MTFRSSIVKKTDILPNEMIHIMPECVVNLHGHWNKVVPLMKPSILADLTHGTKFRNYTYWSTNDIRSDCLLHWVNNHHIGNEDLVLSGHVKIDL
jgi:hypothetical protein